MQLREWNNGCEMLGQWRGQSGSVERVFAVWMCQRRQDRTETRTNALDEMEGGVWPEQPPSLPKLLWSRSRVCVCDFLGLEPSNNFKDEQGC